MEPGSRAPGLYVQAMEVLLEAAHQVPTITYTTHGNSLICSFEDSELSHDHLSSLVLKVNHLVKVTMQLRTWVRQTWYS